MKQLLDKLNAQSKPIAHDRIDQLTALSQVIVQELDETGKVDIIVICTHNSRRSQITELWINYLAQNHGLDGIRAYSGGTEATSFNQRMLKAVKDFGFDVRLVKDGPNPEYEFLGQKMFSKKYNHSFNPATEYIAIMVCDSADEACPIVRGAKHRIALKYTDPKIFDDTPKEAKAYTDKLIEIGKEMYRLFENL